MKDLDQHAVEIGMGGHLSPEKDEEGYRHRMKRRKEVQQKRLEQRNQEKSSKTNRENAKNEQLGVSYYPIFSAKHSKCLIY